MFYSMTKVEYFYIGTLVQVSSKFDIEYAIIRENSARFRLVYSSLLLWNILLQKYDIIVNVLDIADFIKRDYSNIVESSDLV